MAGDRGQTRAQIESRIEAVELGCSDERVERGSALATGVGPHEQVVLPVMQIFA